MENITARKMSVGNLRGQNGSFFYSFVNNCKGRFACLQYASNNRCFSVASTDLRMSVGMWLFCCILLKVKTELFKTEMSQTKP